MKKSNKPIDDSHLYLCPKNQKHQLRKSDSTFCEVWCDTCKNGWMKNQIRMKNQAISHLVFLATTKKEDYEVVKIVLDQAALAEIKKYQKIILQDDMRFAKIQAKINLKESPIAFEEARFSEDPSEQKLKDFRYLLNKRSVDHEHNFPHLPSESVSLKEKIRQEDFLFELSPSGISLVPSKDSWQFRDETNEIKWSLLK